MSLRFRYASFLFIVLALLVFFSASSVYFLLKGAYLLTICLLALLYLTTYQLGRKFSKIFLTLSFLRVLKQRDGVISLEYYHAFIDKALASRKSSQEKGRIARDVLDILVREGVITIQGSVITLAAL